jgi:hypothetical protein
MVTIWQFTWGFVLKYSSLIQTAQREVSPRDKNIRLWNVRVPYFGNVLLLLTMEPFFNIYFSMHRVELSVHKSWKKCLHINYN